MDSEQNKRWVVKSANSDVLARIKAVFVTVEPKGGSEEPTGKPFLEAYLHSLPPKHPRSSVGGIFASRHLIAHGLQGRFHAQVCGSRSEP